MKSILFSFTGNSCNSQVDEGWIKHFTGETEAVYITWRYGSGKPDQGIVISVQ